MLEVLFIGLSLGSILLLVALGLAITYGAMGVINMAHGEMVMIGAYVTVLSGIWIMIQQAVRLELGLSFFGIHIQGLGPGLQNVSVPAFLQGTFSIAGADINRYRTFIILVTAILALIN